MSSCAPGYDDKPVGNPHFEDGSSKKMFCWNMVVFVVAALEALVLLPYRLSQSYREDGIGGEQKNLIFTMAQIFLIKIYVADLVLRSRSGLKLFLSDLLNWCDLGLMIVHVIALIVSSVDTRKSIILLSFAGSARFWRVLRLFALVGRFRFFKELTLMVHGLESSFKILMWAIIFVAICVFIMACMLTSLAGLDEGEDPLMEIEEKHALFGSVGKSMFTSFTCLVEGCTDSAGAPVSVYLFRSYGYEFAFPYVTYQIFVVFGVFTIVVAIFVDNMRTVSRDTDEQLEIAYRHEYGLMLKETFINFSTLSREDILVHELSREEFNAIQTQEAVKGVLDNLEVHEIDRVNLFDVLDADGSGTLSLNELIEGIMLVRGNLKKSDVVATRLAVKAMQKQLANCRLQLQRQGNDVIRSVNDWGRILMTRIDELLDDT
jgi:hypothetical protein